MIGKLVMTRDPGYVQMVVPLGPTRVIELDDVMALDPSLGCGNVMCGSILLPPPTIMSAAIEESIPIDVVRQQFFSYLHLNEPRSFLAGIVALMIKGINVVIVLDKVDPEFSFIPTEIYNFFMIRYGIIAESIVPNFMSSQFRYPVEAEYLDTIYEDLFVFDYMDAESLKKMHSAHPYSMEVDTKLRNFYNYNILQTDGIVNPFINLR